MRKRVWLLLVAAVAAFVVARWGDGLLDLRVYLAGGQQWLDGARLYTNEFRGPLGLPFTYPPFAAALFGVLAVLPWVVTISLWTVAGLMALALTCITCARDTKIGLGFAAACIALEPVWRTLELGQINLILMGLVAADCLLPRTPWPRGLLIGLAAAIKLTPAIFILFFLARKQWRPVVTAGLSFAGCAVIGFALAPKDSAQFWLQTMFDHGRVGGLAYTSNQSLRGLLFRLGIDNSAWIVLCLAVVALTWFVVARTRDDLAALVAVATAGLLISPVSWSHHWVWVAPALILLRKHKALIPVALVFVLAPHWWLPNTDDQELHWTWWEHILGNTYVWAGLTLLAFLTQWSRPNTVDVRPPRTSITRSSACADSLHS